MTVPMLLGACILLSLATLATMFVVLIRLRGVPQTDFDAKLTTAGDRLERVLREEAGRGREEANVGGKALREEVANQILGFQNSVLKRMVEMQEFQKSQLDFFSGNLREGVMGIDRRVEEMTKTLQSGIDEMGKAGESRQEKLQQLVDGKLTELKKDSSESDRDLRQEVQNNLKSLGEGITSSIGHLGNIQKEKLEAVAQEISKLIEKQQQDQIELRRTIEAKLVEIRTDSSLSAKGLREEVTNTFKQLGETLTSNIATSSQSQKERLEQVAKEIAGLTQKQEQTQENLRKTVEQRLDTLRGDNAEKLESIRKTVDEQLHGTLEKRLGESFKLVSERLEQVHKGLGEMQTLANGVGDLKRVLTNVKARGTWGEVQLGNLLEQMLAPDQYAMDVATKPGSQERVEFAVRLPGKGEGDQEVLLPIGAKFPSEDYERLISAAERADADAVEAASKQLDSRIKACAKDIRDKYINPPHTTDFAILFLPTEGLYAEVLRRPGAVEQIQRDFRVTIAGPTTLAATLNALQMGFRTLAIQKRSSEVWQVLEAVKTEFGKYGLVLDKVQKKLQEASKTIDDVAVRRRAIDRRLRAVGSMPEEKAEALLGIGQVELEELAEPELVEAET